MKEADLLVFVFQVLLLLLLLLRIGVLRIC